MGDSDRDGSVSSDEFLALITADDAKGIKARTCLRNIGIPLSDAKELFTILDWDGVESVNIEEFLEGCARTLGAVGSGWDSLSTHSALRSLARNVWQVRSEVS